MAGVPFKRSGTERHCAMRWANASSRPRIRARRRLPFAALAAARAASAVGAFADEHLGDLLLAESLQFQFDASRRDRVERRRDVFGGQQEDRARRASLRVTSTAPAALGDVPVVVSSTSSTMTIW